MNKKAQYELLELFMKEANENQYTISSGKNTDEYEITLPREDGNEKIAVVFQNYRTTNGKGDIKILGWMKTDLTGKCIDSNGYFK